MAIVKISELPAATTPVSPADLAAVVQGNVTKKAAVGDFGFLPAGVNAVTRTIQSKLQESVSVLDFGAVADGDSLNPTDNYAAFAAALATGKSVFVPDGSFMVDLTPVSVGPLYMAIGQTFYGTGNDSKILVRNASTTQKSFLQMRSDCTVHDLNFDAYNTTTPFIDTSNNTDPLKNFDYNDYIIGVGGVGNSKNLRVQNCRIAHFWRGLDFGNTQGIVVTGNYIYQIGAWMTQFYICDYVTFSNNICVYGGGSGGVAASSCKNSTFSGNIVIGPGTGINPGGSPDPAFNVEKLSITGNWIKARDCIVCENGVQGVTISGNYCEVLVDNALPFQNGVGIAATSDSSGTAAGVVGNVTIAGNTVVGIGATGILVGSTSASFSDVVGVVVSNNIVKVANQGIFLRLSDATKKMRDVVVTGNQVVTTRGIQIDNLLNAVISNNVCKSSGNVVVGNYYGIYVQRLVSATISDNISINFGAAIKLETVSEVALIDNKTVGAGTTAIQSDPASTGWYAKGLDCTVGQTTTDNLLRINSANQTYAPASPVTIGGLLGGYSPDGEIITIRFTNTNTTIQHGNNIFLLGGVTVNPPSGGIMMFAKNGVNLYEINRNF